MQEFFFSYQIPLSSCQFNYNIHKAEKQAIFDKVGVFGDVGSYILRVTEHVFANYVTINKATISLAKGVTYELPITPNYTYKGYNGAKPLTDLSVSVYPTNADEQKVWWNEDIGDVLQCSYGWDDDGDRYIHVTAKNIGTQKLFATDWSKNGKRDECMVTVNDTSIAFTSVKVKCSGGLSVMSAAVGGNIIGMFNDGSMIELVNEVPQNETMFYVHGTLSDGTETHGWCSGEYLEKEVIFKEWNGSGNINVRLETSTNTNDNIIGKLPPTGKLKLLKESHTKNEKTWHKISYANRDAYIADQPELSTVPYWLPLVRKKAGGTLTDQDINHIVANVQNCSEISISKRDVAASFAKILLENDYEPTFVAGILANLEKEGNIGQLENSNYISNPNEKPDYLKYMDSEYNGLNYYLNHYSNKTIMDLGVNAVYNILHDLKNASNNTWKINDSRVGFGVGSFQWTFDRSWKLMIKYREQNNNADTINNSQVINSERSMLIDELNSEEYYDVLPFWEDQCTSCFDTISAANRAGFTVCTHYLKPKDTNQPRIRATLAEQIYDDMME